jgi:serine/threonine protein kinase
MSVVTLAEGSTFAGRYKILRSIAAGGMGAEYEVLHIETARRRALKVMLPHLLQSDDLRKRFQAEARIAGQVESAYIVDIFDAGIDETTQMPFLVMELLKGEELGKRLGRVRKFGYEETVGYLWQAALALDKTHRANIVHRDLKPANLFLCEDDEGPSRIKVLDFGIAKLMEEGGTQANATRAMGTPLYMAPEQFKSKSRVSPATDIYALGMMAYTMLVGVSYWADEQATEDNPYAFAGLVSEGPPEPPTARAARRGMRLPEAFDEWFGQATSPNPDQRFFRATVAVKGLAQALGVAVPATSAGHAASSTDPLGAVAGQTVPGQTDAGRTGPGQTGSGRTGPTPSSSSGPQGTVVLESAPPPADQGTHASGYGLSSSQPRVASVPSIPPIDTPHTPAIPAPPRGKTMPMVIAGAVGLVAVGIGVVVFGAKDKGATADAPTPTPSVTTVALVEPTVIPSGTVKPVESAAPESVAPTVDGSAQPNVAPVVTNKPALANSPGPKQPLPKSTSAPPAKPIYERD